MTVKTSVQRDLEALKQHQQVIADIQQAINLLSWDQNTYMPPGAAAARAQQMATLSKISHGYQSDAKVKTWLDSLEAAGLSAESDEAALLRLTRRAYERATKLPGDFVEDFTRQRALAQQAWIAARQDADFAKFAPSLQTMVDYSLRQADYLGYEDHPYDALHDLFEPGSKVAKLRAVFGPLRDATVELVREIVQNGRDLSDAPVHQVFDETKQEQFAVEVIKDFGYDFERGRLDRTVHPFAQGISNSDVRITTRYSQDFLNPALFGTLHEAGHAIYEQGIADAYQRSPLGNAISLGIHESQSRLWENLIGRSYGFWQHAYPRLQEIFSAQLAQVSLDDYYAAINKVEPSLIRVEADEVTYNLHIMIRFELELSLLEGSLAVTDLPEAWNEKYREYLGITPSNDAEGCLQDIHWSLGAIAYFPTYTLGNIMSVQFFEAAKRDQPEIEKDIAQGKFDKLFGWLREHIHIHGSKYEPEDLLKRATGSELDARPYIDYLNSKFRTLYGLPPRQG